MHGDQSRTVRVSRELHRRVLKCSNDPIVTLTIHDPMVHDIARRVGRLHLDIDLDSARRKQAYVDVLVVWARWLPFDESPAGADEVVGDERGRDLLREDDVIAIVRVDVDGTRAPTRSLDDALNERAPGSRVSRRCGGSDRSPASSRSESRSSSDSA